MTLRINLICSEPRSICRAQMWVLNRKKRDSKEDIEVNGSSIQIYLKGINADSHIACPAMPCREEFRMCLSHLIYTVRPCLIHTCHAMPRPCPALTMPFSSRPRRSTAVERRPVGYLPTFGFFRLPRGVPRRFLSEAYQSSSQRAIPTTVKSGSSTLQKKRRVKPLD
jgi:hypothetical protein